MWRLCNVRTAILTVSLALCLATGCSAKKKVTASTPGPIRSEIPPPTAETVEHCVVVKQENENTVTCSCQAVTTRIDAKTGHTTLVCKATQEQSR